MNQVVRGAIDGHVSEASPNTVYAVSAYLALDGNGTAQLISYIWLPLPFPAGATLSTSKLRIFIRGGFTGGPHTFNVRRISAAWKTSGVGALSWNAKPAVTGAVVSHNAGSNLAAGSVVEIDVTTLLAEAAAGSPFYGFRVMIDTVGIKTIHSAQAPEAAYKPEMNVTWNTSGGGGGGGSTAGKPTDLRPGGASRVSLAQPTFAWTFNDAEADGQSAFQVQIDETSDFASPFYDSGYVTSAEQQLDAGALNALEANDASFEGGIGEWVADLNSTIAQDAAQAADGTKSLRVRSVAAGDMRAASSGAGAAAVAVSAGRPYTARASFRAATVGRQCQVEVEWYNSGGTSISVQSSTAVADVTTGWTEAALVGQVAPAGAVTARVRAKVAATGAALEDHYVDKVGLSPGSAAWVAGTGFEGLVAGQQYFWRVRTKDTGGVASEWSDTQEFRRVAQPGLTITTPAADNDDVQETTPPISHTFAGQVAVQYVFEQRATSADAWEEMYDSGPVTSTATTFSTPAGIVTRTDYDYRVTVRAWDAEPREATPGDERYVEAVRIFQFVPASGPSPTTSLTVTTGSRPAFALTWDRVTTPDYFAVKANGQIVAGMDRLDPETLRVDANTYTVDVWELLPLTDYDFEVVAVVLDLGIYKHSTGNATALDKRMNPSDAWVICPTKNLIVPLFSADAQDYEIGEVGETYFLTGRRDPVRITDVIRGYEGTLTGAFGDYDGVTGTQYRARLEDLKAWHRKGEGVVIYHGGRAFRAVLGKVSCVPVPNTDNDWHEVSVQFWQTSGFFVPAR